MLFQAATSSKWPLKGPLEPDPRHWLYLSPADALDLTLLGPQPPACEDCPAPWPEAHGLVYVSGDVAPAAPQTGPLTDVGGADVPAGVVSGRLAWANGPSGAFRPTPHSACTA